MRTRTIGTAVASVMTTALMSLAPAAPAAATEECRGFANGTQTISVLGEEIYRAPGTSTWICVTYPSTMPTPPSLEVTTTPARIVQLVHPDGGGEEIEVYVYNNIQPYDSNSHDVGTRQKLPIPMDGGKTCLFFQGNDVYSPGECAISIAGATTLDDTINDVLDDLPLP